MQKEGNETGIYASAQLLEPLRSSERWPFLAGMMNLPVTFVEDTSTG